MQARVEPLHMLLVAMCLTMMVVGRLTMIVAGRLTLIVVGRYLGPSVASVHAPSTNTSALNAKQLPHTQGTCNSATSSSTCSGVFCWVNCCITLRSCSSRLSCLACSTLVGEGSSEQCNRKAPHQQRQVDVSSQP